MSETDESDESIGDLSSDADLLKRLQTGEQAAAIEIYERYADRLLRLTQKKSGEQLASRLDAEDIVQSVFRTFFRRATEGHYELPAGDELWKLFLVISLNKIRKKANYHSAAKRDAAKTQAIGQSQPPDTSTPSDVLRMTVDELIAMLPTEHQTVVRLRIQSFEIDEIAQRSGLSRRTTERVLQSFRRRLQQELELGE
ncbi:MAG: sigma-70 family RNA polymerase sigma factor [Pirellulales bacterium]